jgi:hypothetical protein
VSRAANDSGDKLNSELTAPGSSCSHSINSEEACNAPFLGLDDIDRRRHLFDGNRGEAS